MKYAVILLIYFKVYDSELTRSMVDERVLGNKMAAVLL